jgi:hypothetical protein
MGIQVYANGMSIACKAADGKSAAASPDVCMSPPTPPGVPVPVPYPNTAMASDTTDGSKTVQINGQEVMLKDKSTFKTSTGDEAATKTLGMGVVTHQIQGEASFVAWSMDVKFEGENVPRHMDLMGHNEGSDPPNTPPWAYFDSTAIKNIKSCDKDRGKAKKACATSIPPDSCTKKCKKAQQCILAPKGQDKTYCCAPNRTGHHLIEDHWVSGNDNFPMAQGRSGYNAAPTVCANQYRSLGTLHRLLHDIQGTFEESFMKNGARYVSNALNGGWNYGSGKEAALVAHSDACKGSKCARNCISAQLDAFYGDNPNRPLNSPDTQGLKDSRQQMAKKYSPSASGGAPF